VREVTIPSVGMAMTEAVLNAWLKNPGDSVAAGETLAEIETDKSVLDLESPSDGLLGRHLVPAGATVPVGQVIVRILSPGEVEASSDAGALAAGETTGGEATAGETAAADTAAADSAGVTVPGSAVASAAPGDRVPHTLSPRKRQQLREQAAAAAAAAADLRAPVVGVLEETETAPGQRGQRFRSAIAEHVSQSWQTIPHFAVLRYIDARGVQDALAVMRRAGLPATATDLFLHALATALTTCAADTGDLGLAVATTDGVMIPVVAGVSDLGPDALVAARAAAVARARDGQLSAHDLAARPLASLSNLGGFGVESFTGIIPVGQQLLLTTGTIIDRPVAVDGLVTVQPSFSATLNVDHRHFDGDGAARILETFQSVLNQSRAWAGHKEQVDA
jgi:pyruvate dehydrogenase E2 component (dihydrolipoamide acetyltransferase)